MNLAIENICTELQDFTRVLKQDASKQIKDILPKAPSTVPSAPVRPNGQVSNPERPWMVAGIAAVVAGGIGLFTSSGSAWPYVVATAGIGSVIYGNSKKTSGKEGRRLPQTDASVQKPKSYEVSEKVIEISKMVENRWKEKVETCKAGVQQAVNASYAAVDLKDSLLNDTYTTERVSIDFDNVLNKLESHPASSYPIILSDYDRIVSAAVEKAATDQIAIYKKISQKL